MNQLSFALSVFYCLAGVATATDQVAKPAIVLTLDLTDGSRIVGTPSSASLSITTPYASLDLPLIEVEFLKLQKDRETVQIGLRNGDQLTGTLDKRRFALTTLLGPLEVPTVHVLKVSVRQNIVADVKRGLVLHYSFDDDFDQSGQIKDEMDHGPLLRVSKPTVTRAVGIRGGAAQFQGGTLSCDSNPTAGLSDITLSIWFKTDDPTRNYKLAAAAWWRGGLNASGWNMGTHYSECWADNMEPMFVKEATTKKPERVLHANQWNHLVVTFNREVFKEYINGRLYRSSKCTGVPIGRGANLTLGSWMGGFPYSGLLDEFMVFDRALSAEEVRLLHDAIHR